MHQYKQPSSWVMVSVIQSQDQPSLILVSLHLNQFTRLPVAVIRSLNLHVPDLRGIGIQMTKLEPVKVEEEPKSRMMIQDYFKDDGRTSGEPLVKKSSLSTHTLVPSIFDKVKPKDSNIAGGSKSSPTVSVTGSEPVTSVTGSEPVTSVTGLETSNQGNRIRTSNQGNRIRTSNQVEFRFCKPSILHG